MKSLRQIRESRIEKEIRDAIKAGILPDQENRVTIRKEGFDVLKIGEWNLTSTIVSIWNEFLEQVNKTYEEKEALANASLSGLLYIE